MRIFAFHVFILRMQFCAQLIWFLGLLKIFMWFSPEVAILGGGRGFYLYLNCKNVKLFSRCEKGSATGRQWGPLFNNYTAEGRRDYFCAHFESLRHHFCLWSWGLQKILFLGDAESFPQYQTLLYSHQETHAEVLISHLPPQTNVSLIISHFACE